MVLAVVGDGHWYMLADFFADVAAWPWSRPPHLTLCDTIGIGVQQTEESIGQACMQEGCLERGIL